MPDTPLNPDGVLHAMDTLMAETDTDERATEWAHMVTTRVLEGYFAVAQPVVATMEELNALPVETVILDGDPCVLQMLGKSSIAGSEWAIPNTEGLYMTGSITLPARVLYRPEVKP